MTNTTGALSEDERAELERLRAEKQAREEEERAMAERAELERLRAEQARTQKEKEEQQRAAELRERNRRLMEPDDDLRMPLAQKIVLALAALIMFAAAVYLTVR